MLAGNGFFLAPTAEENLDVWDQRQLYDKAASLNADLEKECVSVLSTAIRRRREFLFGKNVHSQWPNPSSISAS